MRPMFIIENDYTDTHSSIKHIPEIFPMYYFVPIYTAIVIEMIIIIHALFISMFNIINKVKKQFHSYRIVACTL